MDSPARSPSEFRSSQTEGHSGRRKLFCRRASIVDAKQICDVLSRKGPDSRVECCEPKADHKAESTLDPCFAHHFRAHGLPVPEPSALQAAVEDLLSSTFLCQLCETENGDFAGFMALGHSPIVTAPFCQDAVVPASLANEPDVHHICRHECGEVLTQWPRWLKSQYSWEKQNSFTEECSASEEDSSSSSESDSSSDDDSDTDSNSSQESNRADQCGSSGGIEGSRDDSQDSVIVLKDGKSIVPTKALWLLFFVHQHTDPSGRDELDSRAVADAMLESAFATMYELDWILRIDKEDELRQSFPPLEAGPSGPSCAQSLPQWYSSAFSEAHVGACHREAVLPPLRTRIAEVEDHDDLVEIFDRQTILQSSVYGEFFLAELIGAQDAENKCLVSEVGGRARGMASFAADVDLCMLINCFDVTSYDRFIKPAYHNQIKATMIAEQTRSAAFTNTEGEANTHGGDIIQAALRAVPGGVLPLVNALKTEEGMLSQTALLMAFERVPRLPISAAELRDAVVLIVQQATLWGEIMGNNGALPAEHVLKALRMFLKLDLNQMEKVGQKVLNAWPAVSASISAAIASQRRRQRSLSRFSIYDSDSVPRFSLLMADNSPQNAAPPIRRGDDSYIPVALLIQKLQEADTSALSEEETVNILLALHWWGTLSLDSKTSKVNLHMLESSIKAASTAALRHFANAYDSETGLQCMPNYHKNVFALNVFAMQQELYSQALDLLLPAFSLFPDKEYMIILQPTTSGAATAAPLLSYFELAQRRTESTLPHCLYVLHRDALLSPLIVSPVTPRQWKAAEDLAESVGFSIEEFRASTSRNGSASNLSAGVEESDNEQSQGCGCSNELSCVMKRSSSSIPDNNSVEQRNSRVLVCMSRGAVVGVACLTHYNLHQLNDIQATYHLGGHRRKQSLMLQQLVQQLRQKLHEEQARKQRLQCCYGPLPPLPDGKFLDYLEEKATRGNILLRHFAVSPAFSSMHHVILRDIMRLTNAELLHMSVPFEEPIPAAWTLAIPLLAQQNLALRPLSDTTPFIDMTPTCVKTDTCTTTGDDLPATNSAEPLTGANHSPSTEVEENRRPNPSGKLPMVANARMSLEDRDPSESDGHPSGDSVPARSPKESRARGTGSVPGVETRPVDWTVPKTSESSAPRISRLVCSASLLSIRQWRVTARLVFVGSCATAISAIKYLVLGNPTIKFVDVTLLSPSGIPSSDEVLLPLLSIAGVETNEGSALRQLLFDIRVRVVTRSVRRIDRSRKRIYVSCCSGGFDCVGGLANDGSTSDTSEGSDTTAVPDTQRGPAPLKEEQPSGSDSQECKRSACGTSFIAYDLLILTDGMHDAALQQLGIRSWGLSDCGTATKKLNPSTNGHGGGILDKWTDTTRKREVPRKLRKVNGCISASDPLLHTLLGDDGPFLTSLRWNPLANAVVYGRSLDAFCLVQALMKRHVPPQKISLVIPPRIENSSDELIEVDEFRGDPALGNRCLQLLRDMGVRVHANLLLQDVVTESQGKLKGVILSNCETNAVADAEQRRMQHQAPNNGNNNGNTAAPFFRSPEEAQQALRLAYQNIADDWNLQDDERKATRSYSLTSLRPLEPGDACGAAPTGTGAVAAPPVSLNTTQMMLPCRLLLTADRKNIDWDLFEALHDSGLVYDGRLIVRHDFSTNDPWIYGAGSLAEFHRCHRPTRATDLRQEGYCPEEVGFYVAAAVGRRLNPLWLRQKLPPLGGDLFNKALLDPRTLRPSMESVMLYPQGSELPRCPPDEEVDHYIKGLIACLADEGGPCNGLCTNEEDRMSPLPRFSAPLCAQGELPGGLLYCRLSTCSGCLSKYTHMSPPSTTPDYVEYFEKTSLTEQGDRPQESLADEPLFVDTREVRTDTLCLNWGPLVISNSNGQRKWKHLESTNGQVCVLKWDALTRLKDFRYLGPRPVHVWGFKHLLSHPLSLFNKIQEKIGSGQVTDMMEFLCEKETWANAMLENSFMKFLKDQQEQLRKNPSIMMALERRHQSLREKQFPNKSSEQPSCAAVALDKALTDGDGERGGSQLDVTPFAVPIGASWSEQRQAAQLVLSVEEAESLLHPLLQHDVQRQLIEYLREMQRLPHGANMPHKYYIPSDEAIDAKSKAMLSQIETE